MVDMSAVKLVLVSQVDVGVVELESCRGLIGAYGVCLDTGKSVVDGGRRGSCSSTATAGDSPAIVVRLFSCEGFYCSLNMFIHTPR
ncbi:hypothetical protein Hanom_Chr14g01256651 [Helianthus anomalus]